MYRCDKSQAILEVDLEYAYALVLAASLEPCLPLSNINMISFCACVFFVCCFFFSVL